MNFQSIVVRKMTAAFFVTMITSMILAYWYMSAAKNEAPSYQLGVNFLGWTFLYALYVGAVVLIYGNLVSGAIEYAQKKGFIKHNWLYILCHGLFGLLFGFLFKEPGLAVAGMAVAILYAFIDRWMCARENDSLSIKLLFLSPIVAGGLLWGYFQLVSEPMPPFTVEDAIKFAADGEDSVIEDFPKKAGIWQGMIGGYHVERATSAKEIGREKYLITFTETWEKGGEKGSWIWTYEVERDSVSAKSGKGTASPYAN